MSQAAVGDTGMWVLLFAIIYGHCGCCLPLFTGILGAKLRLNRICLGFD
jgi:hypothetical protein